jgi:cytochrome c biogenesis protein CcmG, thiol:disulfide interchange protein DsbE
VRPRLVPILISIAGACVIGLLIYGISTQSASRTLDTEVHEGHHPIAPNAAVSLPRLGGEGTGSLASQRGKVVLLNFWASWCVPCEREAPLLEKAEATLQHYHGTVLGVTYKDATPDSENFVRRFHLTYPSLRDGTGNFAAAYGTDQLPESFLVDRYGRVVMLYRGEIGKEFIEKAIALARSS